MTVIPHATLTRRAALSLPAALAALPVRAQSAATVRLIVPFAPGGAIDTIGRFYAQAMGPSLGQNWVVENRTGGNGVIGARAVAAATPDGRTLMFHADAEIVGNHVMRDPGYDSLTDFTPVARVAQGPLVLVGHPSIPARDLPALTAAMRADPSRFAFANSSLGALGHLATEWFKRQVGAADATLVSYRGTAPALNDVLAGSPNLMMAPMLAARPLVQGGQLRAYAVCAPQRSAIAPEIPTGAEGGLPGLNFVVWYGMWGPKNLPEAIVTRLNDAAMAAGRDPEMVRRLAELGCEPVLEDAAGFRRTIAADYARNVEIIRLAGIQPE
ncbi:Bug family tripartite tricarboxylate transporter substrate binding protein [Roseomonas sp. BN140053]|uniref:Bug family tripartite tricarboxylate transporter substrate binding protein n=1 Tax=Roseomonas sp. BN140053 TaxID=3391898 RepID=UPI0039ED161E